MVPGFGVPVLFAGLLVVESGVPLPVPGDVLMLLVGERAAAHALPLWLAVVGLEAVVVAGTAALFFAARGPGRGVVRRFGARVGLTPARLDRASTELERRGEVAIAVGRATPSLRTLTAIVAALSSLPARKALPLLVLGGSVFIQLHLVLGFFLGPVAERVFRQAVTPALIALAALVLLAIGFWIVRRGRGGAAHAWSEATCPVCLALHAAARR